MHRATSGLDGVFLGSHAISTGMLTPRQLRDRGYRKVLHGVYAMPDVPVDHALYCRGASLVLPPGAVLGGRSAAFFQAAPWAGPRDPVTVLVPPSSKWTGRRGVRVHRTALLPGEVQVHAGLPMTVPIRTAWDVAALESLPDAVAALDAMVRSDTLTASSLQAMIRTGAGRWRVSRVRRAVELVDPRAESPAESWLRVALTQGGLDGFVPQLEVLSCGRLVARVDFGWPELKIAVEYEGAYHFDGVQIARDDRRLRELEAAGWLVIRVSAEDLRDVPSLLARIRRAIESRRAAL